MHGLHHDAQKTSKEHLFLKSANETVFPSILVEVKEGAGVPFLRFLPFSLFAISCPSNEFFKLSGKVEL
ncbi:hypothetical protein D3C78_1660170 [compost metagenome]